MASAIKFYFDEMMSRPVAEGLKKHGYEVIMAVDAGMVEKDDDTEHLPFAAQNQAVMVTLDKPFAGRAMQRTDHAGLICWTGSQDDIGGVIRALSELAETHTLEDAAGSVFWLR
jgi:predicted nuclease of predicted toxin-antitoxin system